MNWFRSEVSVAWLWRRTSLPAQVLHSSTSFLMMAGMARLAPTHDFALAAALFLIVTLCSSVLTYLTSAVWLRLASEDASERIESLSFVASALAGALFAVFWWAYREEVFGPAPAPEALSAGVAAFAYLFYFARRRQRLLDGRFGMATSADAIRAIVIVGVGSVIVVSQSVLEFHRFLAIFIAAHLAGTLPMLLLRLPRHRYRAVGAEVRHALGSVRALRRGDWLSIGSGTANVTFGQAATLLAPVVLGPTQFATLRAYELFLFPAFFMAQVLDPICMRAYRDLAARGERRHVLAAISWPMLAIIAPLAAICLAVWSSATAAALLQSLIAPEYRESFWLLGLVLILAALIAANVPLRWYTVVTGEGTALLLGTVAGIVLSLVSLFMLARFESRAAWTVLAAKMVYEFTLGVSGAWGLASASVAADADRQQGTPDSRKAMALNS